MNIKNNIEDFLTDDEFVRWVKNADPELELFWTKWLRLYPEKRDLLMEARQLILSMNFSPYKPKEEVKERSLDFILSETKASVPIQRMRNTRKSFIGWKVAGALVVVIMAGFLADRYGTSSEEITPPVEVSTIVKSNPMGQRSEIRLPDGTHVWLNVGSKITYPSKFIYEERVVTIEGEAFFNVKRDTLRPFKVQSNGLVTTALGTSFNVRSYGESTDEIKISLVSGKVSVENQSLKSLNVLVPGEQLIFSANRQKSIIKSFDLKEVVSWKDNILIFKNASMEEVMHQLEKWYGVKISLENRPIEKWDITGEFKKQSLQRVLDRLSFTKEFQYTLEGKKVTIKF
ncbi:DUF4974 domain-containing protein [Fulvivirga sp. M361]|uniref:FecR family protein n=1 Tax=Fulvivirga sp. M361 TaxID=2594266 RepID=UPI00117AF181|nr:FecR domain-containing protein [Fulvivirga sp. M361]TRX58419.1 DUF4974 domain-containing protein [Fulvivirga sp. M361]